MMQITNNPCTACGACASVCPRDAITIRKDPLGFYNPTVNPDLCVDCSLCRKTCPVNHRPDGKTWQEGQYYAMWAKDSDLRFTGSSGGVFGLLAESVLTQGGTVFGAAFKNNYKEVFQTSTVYYPLESLKKSKYVESYTGTVFRQVKQKLSEGKRVLYCGTPCQIDGLKNYLDKEYENLLTCDFLCHGVSAARLYEKYVSDLEKKYGEITSLSFRSKSYGWKAYCVLAKFTNGKKYLKTKFQDPYLRLFFEDVAIRDACSACVRPSESNADITLGDFWRVCDHPSIKDTNQGISLIGVHTSKGAKAIEQIKSAFESVLLEKKYYEYAYQGKKRKSHLPDDKLMEVYNADSLFALPISFRLRIQGYKYHIRAIQQKLFMKKNAGDRM